MDFDSVFIFSNDCLVLLSISRYRRNSNLFFLLDIVGPFETEFAYCHASGQSDPGREVRLRVEKVGNHQSSAQYGRLKDF